MKPTLFTIFILLIFNISIPSLKACSVLYYIDLQTGKIYIANNEDFWYDVEPYIQLMPASKKKHARLWYGWDNFAQGGINEEGLFFDGAVTPLQTRPVGYQKPKGNLGDEILANCSTVEEAVNYLEKEKIALNNGHMMFGDRSGNAVVVEWVGGERKLEYIKDNKLVMTNFLLSETTQGNYPCYRYVAITNSIANLESKNKALSFLEISNTLGNAVQVPIPDENGRKGGTLYSTFIDVTEMEFVLIYKIDNSKVTKLDLNKEFAAGKKRKLKLE
ncbi:carcinine hydrolase/isopenicillin-N N-acyltransferase family protein [Chondrinema litorale]|uniref:carcinine hydrolase/isopenicillin-N N-acyltransferase family protein n=1 Tax=Chondrinema litorale TaxID=2994555 RepID=UPI002543894D|nr:carcinine hydrolase/isopenicillin-N N-acyltransferase family protein [Chondrinema litorale]UZR99176.1 carcinine hydrolase/isopenicillin-N N-acyltransferase family protein [Chondrinema litorale]